MSKWDVYLANVPFEDTAESKIRPIVILDDSAVVIDCLKMTSKPPRLGEYVLQKWREAGLKKETAVRISKRRSLNSATLIKKLGSLQAIDIIEIQKRIT